MITINFADPVNIKKQESELSRFLWSALYYVLWTAVAFGLLWYLKVILGL